MVYSPFRPMPAREERQRAERSRQVRTFAQCPRGKSPTGPGVAAGELLSGSDALPMPAILHAAWIMPHPPAREPALFLWGEEREAIPSAHLSRPRTARRIPAFGALLSPAILRYRLRTLLPGMVPASVPLHACVVHLPSGQYRPHGMDADTPDLQPQKVLGIMLAPPQAIELLQALEKRQDKTRNSRGQAPDTPDLIRYFTLGTDMRYWCLAAQQAQVLVHAGRVIPVLHSHDGRLRVLWEAWSGGRSLDARLDTLADLMPAVNLAYQANAQGQTDAISLLQSFLHTIIQVLMQKKMAHARHGRPYAEVARETGPESAMGKLWQRLLLGETLHQIPAQAHLYPCLIQQWQTWISHALDPAQAGARMVLSLQAPAGDAALEGRAAWKLELGIQQAGHPDGFLRAQDLWAAQDRQDNGRPASFSASHPAAHLLAGIRLASRIYAPVRRILDTPRPVAVWLTQDEAYSLLTRESHSLADAGFRVLLPAWWSDSVQGQLQLQLTLHEQAAAGDRGRAEDPEAEPAGYELAWDLMWEGQVLSAEQRKRLAYSGSPLVYMNDQWLQVNESQIQAARLSLAHDAQPRRLSLFQALQTVQTYVESNAAADDWLWTEVLAAATDSLPDLPVVMAPLPERLQQIRECLQAVSRDEDRPEPPGFVGQLRPYQKRGLAWLWYLHQIGLGACLADDMGLGKTIQTIALCLEQEQIRPPQTPWPRLLICPTSVLRNWQRELTRFAPALRTCLHHGAQRADRHSFAAQALQHDIMLTSFGTARVDQALLQGVPWHTLIIDEAQNIKNPATQQARAIRSLPGQHRVALTGTPVENRLSELWSIMDFLNAGYLGARTAFVRRFVRPIEGEGDRTRAEHLKRIVQPFVLRRLKTDPDVIQELPEKQEINVVCDLTPEQTLLYARAVENAWEHLDALQGMKRRGTILALITRLKKIVNHPAMLVAGEEELDGRSSKLDRLLEMLAEALENRNKAIIFTTFVHMGRLLQRQIARKLQVQVEFLHGGVGIRERQQMVDRFQEGGAEVPILILSLRTGGVGINLTAANQVYHYDRWWNPAVENQATDRAYRIGQTRRVQVFKYIVAGTIEEHVDSLIRNKAALADDILGRGEDWLTELSGGQLYDLLALRAAEA